MSPDGRGLERKDFIMNAKPAFAAPVTPAPRTSLLRAPATVSSLHGFDAYRVALDACRACAPIAGSLSANLRDQLLRASSSVVLNLAEGFGSVSRGVKRRHYEIARGSAVECLAILDLGAALGALPDAHCVSQAHSSFTRTAMMLAKLVARFR